MLKAFAALDAGKQSALRNDIMALVAQFNHANDGTVAVRSEYLEVVIIKRSPFSRAGRNQRAGNDVVAGRSMPATGAADWERHS